MTPYLQEKTNSNDIRLLIRNSEARRKWQNIFQRMKGKNCQCQISYPTERSFLNKGEIQTFSHNRKQRELVTSRPTLKEPLKGFL